MLSPRDLKKETFSKTLKGYSPAEVDEYIRYLVSKYNEAYSELLELEQKYSACLSELENARNEENAISATIVNAQKMADAIVSDAKQKAAEIKSSVSESCDRIIEVYKVKVASERDKLVECENAVAEFKNSLYDAYRKHIALIDNIMPDEEPTPYLSDDELEEKAVEFANEKISPETLDEAEDIAASAQQSAGGNAATEQPKE